MEATPDAAGGGKGSDPLFLHASWDPTRGAVFVWAERSAGTAADGTSRARRNGAPPHPAGAPPEDVLSIFPELGDRATQRAVLYLPSGEKGPFPSRGFPGGNATLEAWNLRGIALDPFEALPLLARAGEMAATDDAVRPGQDFLFWGKVAMLALEFVARGRFLPTVEDEDAVWTIATPDPADAERIDALARTMPGAARAILLEEEEDDPQSAIAGRAAVHAFLNAAVDGLAREAFPRVRPGRIPDEAGARFARSLRLKDPDLRIEDEDELDDFITEIRKWRAPALGAHGELRASFQLEPPTPHGGEEEEGDLAPARDENWTLRFFMEAADDPSLRIPFATVWRQSKDQVRILDRVFRNPQDRALEDLARAARIFEPLGRSLEEPAPEEMELKPKEAHRFLEKAAAALEQAGFGVRLPPGWRRDDTGSYRSRSLGVRLFLRNPPEGEEGGLGLGQLVDYRWEITVGDRVLTKKEIDRISRQKVPLVRIGDEWVEIRRDELASAGRYWTKRRRQGLTLGDVLRLQSGGTGEDGKGLPITGVDAFGGEMEAVLESLASTDNQKTDEAMPAPETFQGKLRPYQERGLAWLKRLDDRGLGACLADDMGLGKTIQVLALLLSAREDRPKEGPTLLLCPTSLVGNWEREAHKFAPDLKVLVHHGASREKGEAFKKSALDANLVISTYPLALREVDTLPEVSWARVVLDEAQNIKNPQAQQTRAVKALAGVPRRIALTGTPVENRLTELWSIFDFLNPGYLGNLNQFRKSFAIPIERSGDEEAASQLRALARPFILRRLKTDPAIITDLPEKLEHKVLVNLTPEQGQLYEEVVEDMLRQIEESEGIARRGNVLATLTRLKQVCDHPILLTEGKTGKVEKRSGKLARLVEMLEEAVAEDDRALIFTQYKEMGTLLQKHLQRALGCETLFLHGGVPRQKREEMVERFQSEDGPPLFILSLKAGGVGLNLTRASRVFHFDRWWNPAVEDQATDRAYRIGQKKTVMVHKFVTAGTLEEKIDAMIESKRGLAKAIVGTGEDWITELTNDELRELLSLRREAIGDEA